MGVRSYNHIEITGLSASGTVDDLGSWNINVDLDSFAAIPAGATAAFFVVNSTTQRWIGFRKPGNTNTESFSDAVGSQSRIGFCPLGAGNTVDIYVEDPSATKVYLIAVVDWVVKSAGETRETFASTSAWADFTLASAPAGTIGALITAQNSAPFSWRPFGSSAAPANGFGRMAVAVDGSYRFGARTANADTLVVNAYITSGATWPAIDSVSETFVADSTWRTSAMTAVGRQLIQIRRPDGSDNTGIQFRQSGSTHNPASTQSTFFEWQFAPVGADGNFQYWLETGATQTTYYLTAYFDDFASTGLSITSVTPSQIDSGESFTITGTGFGATQGLSLVQIGGVTQTPTSWSDTSITCTATRGSQSMGNATLTIYKM